MSTYVENLIHEIYSSLPITPMVTLQNLEISIYHTTTDSSGSNYRAQPCALQPPACTNNIMWLTQQVTSRQNTTRRAQVGYFLTRATGIYTRKPPRSLAHNHITPHAATGWLSKRGKLSYKSFSTILQEGVSQTLRPRSFTIQPKEHLWKLWSTAYWQCCLQ